MFKLFNVYVYFYLGYFLDCLYIYLVIIEDFKMDIGSGYIIDISSISIEFFEKRKVK